MNETFTVPAGSLPGPHWRRFVRGAGRLEPTPDGLRLVTENATSQAYSDAQIDDYQGRRRGSFLWRPPLVLTVRARFSHPAAETLISAHPSANLQSRSAGLSPTPNPHPPPPLLGTAGFGFWNDPFLMTGLRTPALPRALWFFYASPPSDMKLDLETPGWGWKAAGLDAARWPARLLLPFAPLAVPLFNIPVLYRRLWPVAQAALHACERRLSCPMTDWHTYIIEWGRASARFLVDGEQMLACPFAPRGPLGLVIWIDNQYLVATPQGRFRYGLLDVPGRQWLELASVSVEFPARL